MPFYYCCKWADMEDDSETCMMFNYFRTSQDCSNYQPSAIGKCTSVGVQIVKNKQWQLTLVILSLLPLSTDSVYLWRSTHCHL